MVYIYVHFPPFESVFEQMEGFISRSWKLGACLEGGFFFFSVVPKKADIMRSCVSHSRMHIVGVSWLMEEFDPLYTCPVIVGCGLRTASLTTISRRSTRCPGTGWHQYSRIALYGQVCVQRDKSGTCLNHKLVRWCLVGLSAAAE